MNKMLMLVKGELSRMNKYHVTTVSLLTTLLWFALLYFIDDMDILATLLPFVVMIDATMMSMLFVGAIMFFEKTESTISTMLVTPVSNQQLILSKVIANTIHSTLSALLIVLVFHLVKGVEVHWLLVSLALVIGISFHSLLGFVFAYYSKDFTTMMVNIMIYILVISLPSILNFFDVVFRGEVWEHVLLISPTQAVIKLVMAGFGEAIALKYVISLVWLVVGGVLGYLFYIKPRFKDYAVRQSGV
ncbi:MAG: hypothetical protein EA375_06240 [Acholeplasmataceae bacterium]|nr:MAG: hypothetical protein EA375_06240 [Acholeplasmataceae bacterium]